MQDCLGHKRSCLKTTTAVKLKEQGEKIKAQSKTKPTSLDLMGQAFRLGGGLCI